MTKNADAPYLRLDDAKIIESEQVAPGVIVDFDSRNRVVGLELQNVSQRVPKRSSTRTRAGALVREKTGQEIRKLINALWPHA